MLSCHSEGKATTDKFLVRLTPESQEQATMMAERAGWLGAVPEPDPSSDGAGLPAVAGKKKKAALSKFSKAVGAKCKAKKKALAPKTLPVSKAKAKLVPAQPEILNVASNFKKNEDGRKLMKQEFRKMCAMDNTFFATAPTFGPNGLCRMKLGACAKVTLEECVARSPKYFEVECGKFKGADNFGEGVHRLFQEMENEFAKVPPKRSLFLKAVRFTCEHTSGKIQYAAKPA